MRPRERIRPERVRGDRGSPPLHAGLEVRVQQLTPGSSTSRAAGFSYTPHEDHTFWAAVSRAVRTPSRAEEDIRIVLPEGAYRTTAVHQRPARVDSEIVYAYEAGYRAQLLEVLSLDVAGYFNDYDKLVTGEHVDRRVECPPGPPFPGCSETTKTFYNRGSRSRLGGRDESLSWAATKWWRLTGSYTYMDLETE